MLDCEALERAAKKRTGSRVDSGVEVGSSDPTQTHTPNVLMGQHGSRQDALNLSMAMQSSKNRSTEHGHFASAEGMRKRTFIPQQPSDLASWQWLHRVNDLTILE